MKILPVICALVFVTLRTSEAYATAQIPDRVRYAGKEYLLYTEPLEQRYTDGKLKRPLMVPRPFSGSSAMNRGYLATWEIRNGKLYLADIDAWSCRYDVEQHELGCRHVSLEDIVGPEVNDSTRFAGWFSGELRVPQGKLLLYVHNSYLSVYERDIMFRVKAGIVESPTAVDNTKKPQTWEFGYTDRYATPLGSFDISGPPVDVTAGIVDLIIASSGLGKIHLGMTRDGVAALLGRGETIQRHGVEDAYFNDYGDSTIQITFEKQTNTATAIYFFNKGRQSLRLKTDKGVGFDASPIDVLKAYGQCPDLKRRPASDHHPASVDCRYPGIDFRFEQDKLVRIGIRRG